VNEVTFTFTKLLRGVLKDGKPACARSSEPIIDKLAQKQTYDQICREYAQCRLMRFTTTCGHTSSNGARSIKRPLLAIPTADNASATRQGTFQLSVSGTPVSGPPTPTRRIYDGATLMDCRLTARAIAGTFHSERRALQGKRFWARDSAMFAQADHAT